jgi:peptide/nickel transport system permease protein
MTETNDMTGTGERRLPERAPGGLPDEQAELAARLATAAHGLTVEHVSPGRLAWRRFRAHRAALISIMVLAILSVLVFFPGLVTSADPNERLGIEHRWEDPTISLFPPSLGEFPMGTDRNQHDMLSRVLHAGQITLQVGLAVALFAGLVGTTVGLLSGYLGRWVDVLLMRITDLFIAVPFLVAVIILSQFADRASWELLPGDMSTGEFWMGDSGSMRRVITLLAVVLWMIPARLVRAEVLSLREKDYVEAARALGASNTRIMLRHMLPNVLSTIVVAVTLAVAAAILGEAVLSFLGYGVESFTPTWGNMIDDARGQIRNNSHLVWFPGLMIMITVLCINFIGDGVRDAFDPKQLGGRK